MATAVSSAAVGAAPARLRQNWILGPLADQVFFIGAPLWSLAVVAALFPLVGFTPLYALFVIYTVGHHLPTFIRIYGDRDLYRRYRWNFLIGPVIPFGVAVATSAYVLSHGLSLQNLLYLMLIPTAWDTWHFLMQHYGFVRIYDRSNAAPRALAARMDLAICATWFVHIMVQAGSFLPDFLADVSRQTAIPATALFDPQGYQFLGLVTGTAAWAATGVYAAYLVWCVKRRLFVSPAKLLFLASTFGIMYLTYVPGTGMDRLVGWWSGLLVPPGASAGWIGQDSAWRWSYLLGFIVMGLVHNTQYLAIVWKYNRSLARRVDPSRPAAFQTAFAQGGVLVLLGYVALCFAYGGIVHVDELLRSLHLEEWLAFWPQVYRVLFCSLFVVAFTSTLMHYYFDGFIWKVRHRENQQHLAMLEVVAGGAPDREQPPSWWDRWRQRSVVAPLQTALRHALYFGVPLGVLTAAAAWLHRDPHGTGEVSAAQAREVAHQSPATGPLREAERAVAMLGRQVATQRWLVGVNPTAPHYADLAGLLYQQAGQRRALAELQQEGTARERRDAYRENISEAIRAMERALELPGPLNQRRRDLATQRQEAMARIAQWYEETGQRPPGEVRPPAPGGRP